MAVTQKRRNVVKNPGRKLSPAQIKAGFGGKRRKAAAKAKRHKPPARKAKPVRKNKARSAPKMSAHRPRTAPRKKRRAAKKNTGKIVSFLLPKESAVATTKTNRSRKNKGRTRKPATMKHNKRRASRKNPSVGDLGGLVSSAVFVIAGAVGSKYATQMVLGTSNTSFMGYFGNLVSAFVLSWGVKSFMKNEKAAAAVLSGGIVQVVLRLINDYTPFGSYVANIGMGDTGCAGMNAYMPQNFLAPQRLVDGMHSAQLQTYGGAGLSGCGNLYSNSGGLYSAVA